jgi:hypothetical protein
MVSCKLNSKNSRITFEKSDWNLKVLVGFIYSSNTMVPDRFLENSLIFVTAISYSIYIVTSSWRLSDYNI